MFFALLIGLRMIQGIQHRLAVLAELGGAHALDSAEGSEGGGISAGDLAKDAVVADDVGGDDFSRARRAAHLRGAVRSAGGGFVEFLDGFDQVRGPRAGIGAIAERPRGIRSARVAGGCCWPRMTSTPAVVSSTTGRNLTPSGSRWRARPASIRRWSIATICLTLVEPSAGRRR